MVEGRTPSADEQRLVTPDWALDAAAEAGNRSADVIAASGVRVIGDLDALRTRIPTEAGSADIPTQLPIDAAVEAVTTVITAARGEDISTVDQAKALARQVRRDLRRKKRHD